ncbi:MAG: hypothetical protein ACLPKE_03360 [Streptosporangiaceae bacterium]
MAVVPDKHFQPYALSETSLSESPIDMQYFAKFTSPRFDPCGFCEVVGGGVAVAAGDEAEDLPATTGDFGEIGEGWEYIR